MHLCEVEYLGEVGPGRSFLLPQKLDLFVKCAGGFDVDVDVDVDGTGLVEDSQASGFLADMGCQALSFGVFVNRGFGMLYECDCSPEDKGLGNDLKFGVF